MRGAARSWKRRGELRALAASVLVHLPLLWLASERPPPREAARAHVATFVDVAVTELELESEALPVPAPTLRLDLATPSLAPTAKVRGSKAAPSTGRSFTGYSPNSLPEPTPGCIDCEQGEPWSAEENQEPWGVSQVRLATVLEHGVGKPAETVIARPPRITKQQTNEAVRALVRLNDKHLGIGARHEAPIARAVQTAGRAGGLPSGSHFVVTLHLDQQGAVDHSAIEGDGSELALGAILTATLAELSALSLPLGIDEKRAGATVQVRAHVVHALPSGAEHLVTVGECPKLAQVGGEEQPSFFKFGGTPYLEPALGSCTLSDASDVAALRTIQVRTTVTTTRPGDAPPPLTSFSRPPKKKLLPNLTEELLKLLNATEARP